MRVKNPACETMGRAQVLSFVVGVHQWRLDLAQRLPGELPAALHHHVAQLEQNLLALHWLEIFIIRKIFRQASKNI